MLFHVPLNDFTNAFKAYRRKVIEGCRPFLSPHFNLTVELPLKTIVRGYSWTVMPITWRNRRSGVSKLKIREMGSRYLFIALYCWLEKYFSRGDYRLNEQAAPGGPGRRRPRFGAAIGRWAGSGWRTTKTDGPPYRLPCPAVVGRNGLEAITVPYC